MSGAGLIRLISRLGDVLSWGLSRRKFLAAGILGAAGLSAAGCGTIMHPERRGQPAGPIDWKVVALDGIGLFLFFVPGVIAFAVDFATGAIYLPPEQYSSAAAPAKTPLVSVEVPRGRLNQAEIEKVVSRHAGQPVHLTDGAYHSTRLEHIHDFWPTAHEFQAAYPPA